MWTASINVDEYEGFLCTLFDHVAEPVGSGFKWRQLENVHWCGLNPQVACQIWSPLYCL